MRNYSIKAALLKEEAQKEVLKDFQITFQDFLKQTNRALTTAAEETIVPSHDIGGYAFEAFLKSELETERSSRYDRGSKRGAAATDSPTNKFDLSIQHASESEGGGLEFTPDTDASGSKNTNRFIKAEVKCLPAQFGQFKKAQLSTCVFENGTLTYTVDPDLSDDQTDFADMFMENVRETVETFLTTFLQGVNDLYTSEDGIKILNEGFEEYVHSTSKGNALKDGGFGKQTRLRRTRNTNSKLPFKMKPLQGQMKRIDLMTDLYEQIGKVFQWNGANVAVQIPLRDEEVSRERLLQMNLNIPFAAPEENQRDLSADPRKKEDGEFIATDDGGPQKGFGFGQDAAVDQFLRSEGIGAGPAGLIFKSGNQAKRGAHEKIGNVSVSGATIGADKWRDYMAETKDIVIFGTGGSQKTEGCVYSLNPSFTDIAEQFSFPGPVKILARFENGNWRFEASAPKGLDTEYVKKGGARFDSKRDLYDILTGRKLSINPNDPTMDRGSYVGMTQGSDGKYRNVMDHRKRKYSIAAKLLGKK